MADLYTQLSGVMRSRQVRGKLDEVADSIAGRAQGLAASEGVDARIRRESGTRPKGRPYARVLADAAQEYGTAKTRRRRVLGRAAQR